MLIAGFEFGRRAPLLVRSERVAVAGAVAGWRLLYASDLHLTARRPSLAAELVSLVAAERPDAVLLGGDMLDRRDGHALLADMVRTMTATCPVVAVPGNHDAWCGLELVRGAVVESGGTWLPGAALVLRQPGRAPLHLHATPQAATEAGAVRALVGHHPNIGPVAAAHGYAVAFAGHLHGGQCVWWQRGERLYPGAWFSRWNGLRFSLGATTMLVSRGAADTLPLRFRCPREVVRCCLEGSRS